MIKINGFKIGYTCPYCQYIRPEENIENCVVEKDKQITWTSKIKCPTCNNIDKYGNWSMVKYPCIKEQQ